MMVGLQYHVEEVEHCIAGKQRIIDICSPFLNAIFISRYNKGDVGEAVKKVPVHWVLGTLEPDRIGCKQGAMNGDPCSSCEFHFLVQQVQQGAPPLVK